MIEAEVIADSVGEYSPRLTTFRLRYPKFIHGEFMTHRTFSRNASSSRAVPVSKNLAEVRSDELRAAPVWWGREQKGMASGEELDGERLAAAKRIWRAAAEHAAMGAEYLADEGAHKSIVNRILEPFLHINVIATSCEPGLSNFFGLRLDGAAQPEIRVLAEQMWASWNESEPRKLEFGQYHLPFVDEETISAIIKAEIRIYNGTWHHVAIRVSVARCARVSYTSFETGRRSTVEEDLALYDRLITARPGHFSPAEHQATPDQVNKEPVQVHWPESWVNPHLHGNLPGWIQHRKTLPGEAAASLPEGYER